MASNNIEDAINSIDCASCTKEQCICEIIQNLLSYDENEMINQCQECEKEDEETKAKEKLDELLEMDEEDFIEAVLEMSVEDFEEFSKNLDLIDQLKLEAKLADTTINQLNNHIDLAKKLEKNMKDMDPFNGYCGVHNPYYYGSTEYFIQEWVGSSETWFEAFGKAMNGKMDTSVPKEFHDNMTAAEHYIWGKSLLHSDHPADKYVKKAYGLVGWLGSGYQALKAMNFFSTASKPSMNQAFWDFRAWSDGMAEYILPMMVGSEGSSTTELGECLIDSAYFKERNVNFNEDK